jgi:hypothetical protein
VRRRLLLDIEDLLVCLFVCLLREDFVRLTFPKSDMADSATRAQRAAALEEKRRKLDELKKARSRRTDDAQQRHGGSSTGAASQNLDEYIDGLLMTTATATTSASGVAPAGGGDAEGATLSRSISEDAGDEGSSDGIMTHKADAETTGSAGGFGKASPPPPSAASAVETFTVSTQTDDDEFPEQPDRVLAQLESADDDDDDDDDDGDTEIKAKKASKAASGAAAGNAPSDDPAINDAATSTTSSAKDPKILSPDQLQREVSTTAFSSFLNTASKKVERVLGTPLLSELMVELGLDDDPARAAALQQQTMMSNKDSLYRSLVSSRIVFECPRWTSTRDITEIDWSPLHREMILTTHHAHSSAASTFASASPPPPPPSSSSAVGIAASSSSLVPRSSGELQSAGLACVWSLALASRPEHVFAATSPVTSGRFHPSESPLVVGGLESGQLVVWDARAGRMPVQKSALTSASSSSAAASSAAKCHSYPLTGMEIIEGGVSTLPGASHDWK